MINWLLAIVGFFLGFASGIDLKYKSIPSIILTGMVFAVAFLNPANLWFGIMGFIIAYLLYESQFFTGVADLKVMTMLGFMIHTTNWFFIFVILTLIFGFCWKLFWRLILKKEQEIAFIPAFLFDFLAIMLLGGYS